VHKARVPTGLVDAADRDRSIDGLRHAVVILGRIVLAVGAFWAVAGVFMGRPSISGAGAVAVVFGSWVLAEQRWARARSPAQLATRVAIAIQVSAIVAVTIEPLIGPAIALGSLIPVVAALSYVSRRTLSLLMVGSTMVGAYATLVPGIMTWGSGSLQPLEIVLPTSILAIVYLLFEIFLWNASTRLTDTASELRHVVTMSHDLAETLDPNDVGSHLARHLQQVTGATETALSTWEREANRVDTFGFYPPEDAANLEPSYSLESYPATKTVLVSQMPLVVDVDDPMADISEVSYLRSIDRRRLVIVPLVVRGESIGIVELTSNDPAAFDERQIELAKVLTREAALTFDNARLYGEIREQAFRDPLTGLSNRSRFQERVEHSLARLRRSPKRVAVLFIDLDHFKLVNDRFGHTVGDRLLQAVAQRVEASVRPGDTAARLGGDEFAILLEDVEGREEADTVCKRLLDVLAEPVQLGSAAPTIGASVGVAISGLGGETVDELLRNADIAMYAAKAAGRGQVVFFRSELLDLAAARSELAALLRGAEARDELQLHFQPIVALDTGAPVGFEALVRWQPEGHAMHMPAEFIGLAEETGEILAIGRWVIVEACRHAKHWQERFALPELRVYVNLSARQFRDPGLVSIVAGALREAHLDPHHLTLEITETALLTRTPETLTRIGQLRRLGVRLAIDDFGTGYSSLGYLHAFQVDELKIDRSFVSARPSGGGGAGPTRDVKVLSRAIVELGRALGLDVVAEGIETAAQADWFRELGCRYGQGYHYARPMVPAEVDRFLRRGGRRRAQVATTGADAPSESRRSGDADPAVARSPRPRLPRARTVIPPAA
jgi:diguanylate cyclase (GGDEF)-like protein